VKVGDQVTVRLRTKAEHWRDSSRLSDADFCAAVRADGIDLLVDLAGHTASNRLTAFARRPAPTQLTWLGYPNTTGLTAMDYRITDAYADPDSADRWHSEKLLRLPGPFSCYRPPEESPPVAASPCSANGFITFGSFNHVAKLNEPLIHLWAAVLKAVPESRLLLRSRSLADQTAIRHLTGLFGAAAIAQDRLEFSGEEFGVRDHLDQYRRIDLALDSFPYNGATTTCEALWMGVPVVTLAGQTHVARAGLSLLTHAGCAEGIAQTSEEYVRIAAGLASDPAGLARRRAEQRSRVARSPLCDGELFTRSLENALRRAVVEKVAA